MEACVQTSRQISHNKTSRVSESPETCSLAVCASVCVCVCLRLHLEQPRSLCPVVAASFPAARVREFGPSVFGQEALGGSDWGAGVQTGVQLAVWGF